MRLFGYELSFAKAGARNASPVPSTRRGGLWSVIQDWTPGAWQADAPPKHDTVVSQSTVFSCMTLIAGDIGKLRLRLVERVEGIWIETESPAFSPVLRKQNRYQTRKKFVEQWVLSKLGWGNAYVLKERDERKVVVRLHVLDPSRVQPLVAPDGSVYYQLQQDDLAEVSEDLPAVPASEIIHDRMYCLFHPLVGISPLYACGIAAMQALNIQKNSSTFFKNMSRPGGILTAPAQISDETAERLKKDWDTKFSGENSGKVAVLGDGLEFKSMAVNPDDAQMVEQLQLSAKQICATFHVPAHKVGAEPVPANTNVQALELGYYTQCLQPIIEDLEASLDEGLGLDKKIDAKTLGTDFDLDGLLRMDSMTLTNVLKEQVGAGITTPNEARQRLNLPQVTGGSTPYMQQQNYSLAALDARDKNDPFAKPAPAPAPLPGEGEETDDEAKAFVEAFVRKCMLGSDVT